MEFRWNELESPTSCKAAFVTKERFYHLDIFDLTGKNKKQTVAFNNDSEQYDRTEVH